MCLVVSRAVSTTVGVITAHHNHSPLWSIPGFKSNSHQVVDGAGGFFTSWDSFWYLNAAEHGWPHRFNPHTPNTTGFFPAFPVLLRAGHWLTGLGWAKVGLGVEAVIEVGTVLAVALLARQVLGPRLGLWATLLFCLFPGAYIFFLVYSEPLYIFAAAVCLYGLVRRWWWLAGAGAALAGATRSTGIVLVAVCWFVAARELWFRRDRSALIAAAVAPFGTIAVSVFFWVHSGTPFAYQKTQSTAWFQTFKPTAVVDYFRGWIDPHHHVGYELPGGPTWVLPVFIVFGVVTLVLLGVLVVRHGWPSEWLLYSLGTFGATLVTNDVGFRPRMALTAFPLIFAAAWYLRAWWARILAVGVSVAGLIFLSANMQKLIP